MGVLEVLLWILAGIGGVILLSVIAIFIVFVGIFIFGFRLMRDDEATQLPERTDR